MRKVVCTILAIAFLFPMLSAYSRTQPKAYREASKQLEEIHQLAHPSEAFDPQGPITRAEVVALLVAMAYPQALDAAKRDQIYTDVPVSHWANAYITIAFDQKMIEGSGSGTFRPDDAILYEELLKIAVSHVMDGRIHGCRYPDGYLEAAQELGLTQSLPIAAGDCATYAHAAQLALNITQAQGKLASVEKKTSPEYGERTDGEEIPLSLGSSDPIPPPGSVIEEPSPPLEALDATDSSTSVHGDISILPEESYLPTPNEPISAGMLTAGQWNDNDHWDFWTQLMANREWHLLQSRWGVSTGRYLVSVSDAGTPVMGARVELSSPGGVLWTAVTDNQGRAMLFADLADEDRQENAFRLRVETSTDSKTIEGVLLSDSTPYAVEIRQGELDDQIDLMFVIDTTGSMGDELQYIKEELRDVVSRISADNVHISCNFYRDIDDEYIVRPFDFSTDIDLVHSQLAPQRATGGGDYPEAVELALRNAIDEHDWNPNAKEHLLFLVLDAPPHHDDGRVQQINQCIKDAAAKGIRIIPVASSGVNKETEFLLRSMSIVTNGTYVFLTDDSGIGLSHIEPTVGSFQVKHLNDLIVEIINDRLA